MTGNNGVQIHDDKFVKLTMPAFRLNQDAAVKQEIKTPRSSAHQHVSLYHDLSRAAGVLAVENAHHTLTINMPASGIFGSRLVMCSLRQ